MRLLSLNIGATHGYGNDNEWTCYSVEQGQANRPETAAETEGDLGHPDSTATGSSNPGTRVVQPRHRQQVAGVRSGRASRPRRGPGQSRRSPSNRNAEEDSAAGAIRDHRTNAGRGRSLDRNGASEVGPVPLSEPRVGIATSVDPAIRPDRWSLGGGNWARSRGLWHPFDAAHQAD